MLSRIEKQKLLQFLKDDAFSKDITSIITPRKKISAVIKCNEACTLSGLEEAGFLFRKNGLKVKTLKKNGSVVKKNSGVMKIQGDNRKILSIERTALNVLGKMSGIASICSKASKKSGTSVYLTRKTTPGFTVFEKKACLDGKVFPHRKNLNEMVLLKENHLKFFSSISEAIRKAKKSKKKIEIEVETVKEALEAGDAKPNIIMLDNFSSKKAKKTIQKLRKKGFKGKIEVSGGITLKNLSKYSRIGADIISMGELTKKPGIIDFSLEVLK